MNKWVTCILFSLVSYAAATYSEPQGADLANQALALLKQANPKQFLNDFTDNPVETQWLPPERSQRLKEQALASIGQDETANTIFEQQKTRPRIKNNPNSLEMKYAEKLIDGADEVLKGGCYTKPAHCEAQMVNKTCEDWLTFNSFSCNEQLSVQVAPKVQSIQRQIPVWGETTAGIHLTRCDYGDSYCTSANLITVSKECQSLEVQALSDGIPLLVLTQPTCAAPAVTLYLGFASSPQLKTVHFIVKEQVLEDHWAREDCRELDDKVVRGICHKEEAVCLEPNQTKSINGIAVTKACWGIKYPYQCEGEMKSSCDSLLEEGCSQTHSQCVNAVNQRCTRYAQTFQCPYCLPEKTVCPGEMSCADGSCDKSQDEVSTDIGEGISKLAVLTGSAAEVAKQLDETKVKIFTGEIQRCEKYPLGMRDCCTDKGFLDGLIHCPKAMQDLQKAKVEGRVVALGKYRKGINKEYVFCVFPTQLAAIVQIQGRKNQLKIPFGTAKKPDCRGITPKELEDIQFDALDLSPLEKELVDRIKPTSDNQVETLNRQHIEALYARGKPHDD